MAHASGRLHPIWSRARSIATATKAAMTIATSTSRTTELRRSSPSTPNPAMPSHRTAPTTRPVSDVIAHGQT
jgi:hypothetical protein